MLLTRYERAERLRLQVEGGDAPRAVAEQAQGDAAAVQAAWTGFVPLLAHPVMAPTATTAMAVLDEAATLLATRAAA